MKEREAVLGGGKEGRTEGRNAGRKQEQERQLEDFGVSAEPQEEGLFFVLCFQSASTE